MAANRQTRRLQKDKDKEHKSEEGHGLWETKLQWAIRLQTDTCRCHLILHSLTLLANRHRAPRYEGIEPCSVNLTCAGDTGANEDTLQTQWILIVLLHFQQSVTILTVYSTSDWHIQYKSVKSTTCWLIQIKIRFPVYLFGDLAVSTLCVIFCTAMMNS